MRSNAELYHDDYGKGYAGIQVDGHIENWPIGSQGFKQILRKSHFNKTRGPLKKESLEEVLATLEALAMHEGEQHEVHVRVAGHDNKIYLDLANVTWQTIEISSSGWQVVDSPPVRFIRSNGMLPLLAPKKGADINILRQFINVERDGDFMLFVGFLLGALSPKKPYPIMVLNGGHGTAKSTTSRIIKALIDPSKPPLRAPPKDIRDLMIFAESSRCLAFDNISHIPVWLSDAHCQLSTGGAFSTRKLYTDNEQIVFDYCRPVVVNGITDFVTRDDLKDRAIFINLKPISESDRKTEDEFWGEFEAQQPYILGALLDGVVSAIKNLPTTKLQSSPRLADFTKWVTAAEPAFGWTPGTFYEVYSENRNDAIYDGIEYDPIAQAVIKVVEEETEWQRTATCLYAKIGEMVDQEFKKSKAWPSTARAFSNHIRKMESTLRSIGIEIAHYRSPDRKRERIITIKKSLHPYQWKRSSTSSESSGKDETINKINMIPADDGRDNVDTCLIRSSENKSLFYNPVDDADDVDVESRNLSDDVHKETTFQYELEL